jgi:hypothetical protein
MSENILSADDVRRMARGEVVRSLKSILSGSTPPPIERQGRGRGRPLKQELKTPFYGKKNLRWTIDELERLIRFDENAWSDKMIGYRLNRTPSSIKSVKKRAINYLVMRLGVSVTFNTNRKHNKLAFTKLVDYYNKAHGYTQLCEALTLSLKWEDKIKKQKAA